MNISVILFINYCDESMILMYLLQLKQIELVFYVVYEYICYLNLMSTYNLVFYYEK